MRALDELGYGRRLEMGSFARRSMLSLHWLLQTIQQPITSQYVKIRHQIPGSRMRRCASPSRDCINAVVLTLSSTQLCLATDLRSSSSAKA